MQGTANGPARIARDLTATLETIHLGAPSVLAYCMPQVRALLGADAAVTYGLDSDETEIGLSFVHGDGFTSRQLRRFPEYFNGRRDAGVAFNATRPERSQRNRALAIRHLRLIGAPLDNVARQELFPKIGVERSDQLRALICDGPSLLAWVGGYREREFSETERRRLAEVIPALQRRLRLERQLEQMRFQAAALAMALEAISAAAFILNEAGRIRHCNVAGGALIRREGRALDAELAGARRLSAPNPRFSLTRLSEGGWLAIEQHRGDAHRRVAAAAARWQLTRRQAEILGMLATGAPNKTIAHSMKCALRTVEAQVTHILMKAQVESRSALIAKVAELDR